MPKDVLYVSLSHDAIGNDSYYNVDTVGAVIVDPFHNDSKNTGQVEFHHVGSRSLRHEKASKDRVENVLEQPAVNLVHMHRMKMLDRHLEQPLIILDKP